MTDSLMIAAAGLTKVFRNFWLRPRVVAVDNLDLAVAPKQVFGLLGPNGSGKSTTIKLILGLLYPTRGQLTVLGKSPSDVAVKRRIGFLPEESYLYRHLTARETLDFYGQIFRLPRAEANAARTCSWTWSASRRWPIGGWGSFPKAWPGASAWPGVDEHTPI